MPTLRYPARRTAAAVVAACAAAGLVAVTAALPAAAAPVAHRLPKPGKNLIHNGDFAVPGPAKHEGATPTGWKLVKLGAEKKPYSAAIGVYNAKGTYPPPKGNPNKSDIADEAFYEAGTSTGVEGIGGQQTSAKFGSITQANNPQVSFSDVEHSAPEAGNSAWAGTGLQFTFTSGKKSYTLTYFNQWTAYKSTFRKHPLNTKTTKYIIGPTLKLDIWHTTKTFSLNASLRRQFGLTTYRIKDVIFADLEHTINSAYPYANMDGYFADLTIAEGKA
jgi:hypothetical protein